MAYENFIESVEAKKLLTERDKYLILGDHCTREWEGEIEKQGDSIIVKGLSRPTIYDIDKNGTYSANGVGKGSVAGSGKDVIHKGIPEAEEIKGYEKKFEVNKMALFNFFVGDIDKQQSSEKGIISKSRVSAGKDIAYTQDLHIRNVISSNKNCILLGSDFQTNGIANAINITSGATKTENSVRYFSVLDIVDEFIMQLRQNNVKDSEKVVAEASPAFMRRLKTALKNVSTDNVKLVNGREITSYNGIDFSMSNVMQLDSDYDYLFIRTLDSVAFFDPLTRVQPYSPEKGFGDALKGFNLYDAGVVDEKACKYIKIARNGYTD